ncbi:hypothetical protein BC830DRAFT_1218588 [Chytriomyces sp. MP71]|nr:hypothetical protein BC830DRAFT_1218588 [Chytriomyces sp. MP71]
MTVTMSVAGIYSLTMAVVSLLQFFIQVGFSLWVESRTRGIKDNDPIITPARHPAIMRIILTGDLQNTRSGIDSITTDTETCSRVSFALELPDSQTMKGNLNPSTVKNRLATRSINGSSKNNNAEKRGFFGIRHSDWRLSAIITSNLMLYVIQCTLLREEESSWLCALAPIQTFLLSIVRTNLLLCNYARTSDLYGVGCSEIAAGCIKYAFKVIAFFQFTPFFFSVYESVKAWPYLEGKSLLTVYVNFVTILLAAIVDLVSLLTFFTFLSTTHIPPSCQTFATNSDTKRFNLVSTYGSIATASFLAAIAVSGVYMASDVPHATLPVLSCFNVCHAALWGMKAHSFILKCRESKTRELKLTRVLGAELAEIRRRRSGSTIEVESSNGGY